MTWEMFSRLLSARARPEPHEDGDNYLCRASLKLIPSVLVGDMSCIYTPDPNIRQKGRGVLKSNANVEANGTRPGHRCTVTSFEVPARWREPSRNRGPSRTFRFVEYSGSSSEPIPTRKM